MDTRLLVVTALTAAACGDNIYPKGEPLAPASDLAIVAHQDDDLLFMEPDVYEAVQRGTGLTTVYITAGNGTHGLDFAEQREDGVIEAYSAAAGSSDWSCGWIKLGEVSAEHCRLKAASVSLVFLGYPDGGEDGAVTDSLLHLWEGKVTTVQTISRRPSSIDLPTLIKVVTEIVAETQPITLRTMEIASTHGHDHSDHMLVGALSVLATARANVDPQLTSFRGYNIADAPVNAQPALLVHSEDILGHYEACAADCAPCGAACAVGQIDPQHITWLERRYPVAMLPTADGQLQGATGCVRVTNVGENAVVGDCAGAPIWHLDEHGVLSTNNDVCLEVFPLTGEMIANMCRDAGAGGRFFLDDEGHLWSGVQPIQQDDMTLQHLDCVSVVGGRPRAVLCGGDNAPTWQLVQPAAGAQ